MDVVAFLLMASDSSRQPSLDTASWQDPMRFASEAVTSSCPWGGRFGGSPPVPAPIHALLCPFPGCHWLQAGLASVPVYVRHQSGAPGMWGI